jgi:hypothetical protein
MVSIICAGAVRLRSLADKLGKVMSSLLKHFGPRLSIIAATCLLLLPGPAAAENQCEGHNLLPTARAEGSCSTIKAKVYPSPDGKLRAIVLPAEVSLDATPDMESRVVIRSSVGATLNSADYSSPRGANGSYVDRAQWSPDSQFFVYNLVSSGGHSPWSHPTKIFSAQKNQFADLSEMIGGAPIISDKYEFSGPHMLKASTWKQQGAIDDPVPVSVDLVEAFAKLKSN